MKPVIIFTRTVFCLAVFILILPLNALSKQASFFDKGSASPVIERDTTHDSVREYENELDMLDEELLRLKADKEWLYLKIFRIQDQNRIVPQELKEARRLLTRKIAVALKKKNRLIHLIKKHKGNIRQLNRKIDPDTGFNSLFFQEAAHNRSYMTGAGIDEKELHGRIARAGLQHSLEVMHDESGLILKTATPVLFDSGSSKVTGQYKSFLNKLVKLLEPYDIFINVKGYTDSVKFKGNKMTNIELSAKRAGAVIREFKKYGMKPSIFKLSAMGPYQFCNDASARCKILSRRADIIVYFHRT